MKQFRYVIEGISYEWQNCCDVSVAKLNHTAEKLNKDFGNNWYIDYRG